MLFIIDADWVQQLVSDKIIDPKSGLLRPLILPKEESPPAKSTRLFGFGAQRRGVMGRETTTMLSPEYAGYPHAGYIGISGFGMLPLSCRITAIADASILTNVVSA